MKNLLYKEFKLAVRPFVFWFLLSGALLLIPSWPFFVAFMYLIWIGIINVFTLGRANQDIFFTAFLPVPKRDIARARVYSVAVVEVLVIIAAIPFAYFNTRINPYGNMAGMNPNFAFFGFVFGMYALFNAVFIPLFFKTAYKVGVPVTLGIAAILVYAGAVEAAVHAVPVLNTHLNAIGAGHLGSQLIALAAGVAIFALGTWATASRAAKNFEKVDL